MCCMNGSCTVTALLGYSSSPSCLGASFWQTSFAAVGHQGQKKLAWAVSVALPLAKALHDRSPFKLGQFATLSACLILDACAVRLLL